MQGKIFLNANRNVETREIKIHIHGSGGELGKQNATHLVELKTFAERQKGKTEQ